MASGIGIPSIGIYAFELFNFFDVKKIIRIGTAGSIQKNIKLKDLVIATGASTNSNFASTFALPGSIAPVASFDLLKKIDKVIKKLNISEKANFGTFLTTDHFYTDVHNDLDWTKMGILAVEMETAGLYLIAERLNKQSVSICTISNEIISGKSLDSKETETSLNEMITIALETAIL